ncbi:MAG: hypothetical protein Q9162_001456 [Coniocarpon cinnabarinum]
MPFKSSYILATGLTALSLFSYTSATSFYLYTTDGARAFPEQGGATVVDELTILDDDKSALCDSPSQGLDCTAPNKDGSSCTITYNGSNGGWKGKPITGSFATHDSGFDVTAGSIALPNDMLDVAKDTRCEAYKCSVTGFGSETEYKGFRCLVG